MGNQIYKEISKFAEMQRDEIKREKAKKKRKAVCIDPDSVIGKEIMYQTALLHEILDEIRGGKNLPLEKLEVSDKELLGRLANVKEKKEALDRAMAQLESCITSRYEAKKHIAKETYRPALFEDAEEKKP